MFVSVRVCVSWRGLEVNSEHLRYDSRWSSSYWLIPAAEMEWADRFCCV